MMPSPAAESGTKVWNLLPALSAPMPLQMAIDEILFRSGAGPVLRFYFSSEPWVTVGYSYRGDIPDNVPACRRITGGGRVDHGRDLVFSLVASKGDDESFSSVRLSYWKIHEAVKAALESYGRQVRFYRCDENLPRGGDCFQFPIATDLAADGRKVAGGAQKRSGPALLHQESVRIPDGMDAAKFAARMTRSFADTFKVRVLKSELDPELLTQARRLAEEKYSPLPLEGEGRVRVKV